MVETIWRPKRPSALTDSQRAAKLQKDSEYEIAVQNLTVSYKKGEITQEAYREQKSILWNTYKDWAISQGLYEVVTPEQQLAEAEAGLMEQLDEVNQLRVELLRNPFELKERM